MRYLGALYIILLTSCGTSGSSSPSGPTDETDKKAVDNSGESYKSAMLVKDESGLPECTDDNASQLVYVLSTKQFKACDSSAWQVVDIKGQDGANGKDGTSTTTASNAWTDPFTGRYWYFGGGVPHASVSCPSGYTLPSYDDAYAAYTNGMGAVLTTLGLGHNMWFPDHADGRFLYGYVNASGVFSINSTTSTTQAYRLVCYK